MPAVPGGTVSIRLHGERHVRRRLQRMLELPKAINASSVKIADRIVEETRSRTPVYTGLLYSTIQRRITERGSIVTAGDPNPEPPAATEIPGRRVDVDLQPNTPAPYALRVHETHPTHAKFLELGFLAGVVDFARKEYVKRVREAVRG